MTSSTRFCVEQRVLIKYVKAERLDPFIWAVLRILEAFDESVRPEWREIGEKLKVHEPEFLKAAYQEALVQELIQKAPESNDAAGPVGSITDQGKNAVQTGLLIRDATQEWRGELYFKTDNLEEIRSQINEVREELSGKLPDRCTKLLQNSQYKKAMRAQHPDVLSDDIEILTVCLEGAAAVQLNAYQRS